MHRHPGRRTGLTAALLLAPLAAAWRFGVAYRNRAGFPRRRAPIQDPAGLGMSFEAVLIPSLGSARTKLPGWWMPILDADGATKPAPAVVLVHGWESARDRTLPNAQVLHAAGFHVLTFDVRGHGANARELLPVTAAEFGADARAAVQFAAARPNVTSVGILGHSMGGAGALIAAAAEPAVASAVIAAAPAGPYRLTRLTFRLAHLPIPDVIAYPLAWLTTQQFVRPRRHRVSEVSSTRAAQMYLGPLLFVHGTADDVVPPGHARHLVRAARRARAGARAAGTSTGPLRLVVIRGGGHSWLYESARYRAEVARFLASTLPGGPDPEAAAARAGAVDAHRLPDPEPFSAIEDEPGGFRLLVRALARPGARRSTTVADRAERLTLG
ncbi:MAG TPA: alpha/beta fold hydrolase [Candidatus Limnocylindrales bacterium]|nr:alpha/beta fold hydrolase [Candidatus Limnocylindrales bacterium]